MFTSVSGDRPSGRLHIGHFFGSLINRVILQRFCTQYLIIADNQLDLSERSNLDSSVFDMVLDYYSIGIDFRKTIVFLQSLVPELSVLTQFLSNFIDLVKLRRIPTTMLLLKSCKNVCLSKFSFPVYQSSDILIFNARYVPVGLDQLPLIRLTNLIVSNVNRYFKRTVFHKCIPIVGVNIPGIYGNFKMSKSLNNTIPLYCDAKSLGAIIRKIKTDPLRGSVFSTGHYDLSLVMCYLKLFMEPSQFYNLKLKYLSGLVSDSYTKKILYSLLLDFYRFTFCRRQALLAQGFDVARFLFTNSCLVRRVAISSLDRIRRLTGVCF